MTHETAEPERGGTPVAGGGLLARGQRLWRRQPLPGQMVLATGATTAGLVALLALLQTETAIGPVLACGGACALAAAWVAHRSAQGLAQLTAGARQLAREDSSDDLQLPMASPHAELREASVSLRRMVDTARQQRRALQNRINQLDQRLQHRTEELSSLQDLSTGLAGTTDLFELVDEALKALERTLDYSSASIWSRDTRGDSRQVLLAGYRGNVDGADQPLRGKRLSRPNLQRYEQIERTGEPLIDNDARQSLLSWLWEMVTDDSSTSRLYRGTRAWMGVPLAFRDKVLAVLRVDHEQPGYFDAERARLLNAVCSQTALALHHAHLLLQEREQAVVAERNRIARDLHDAVSQTLFASHVIAGTLAKQLASGQDPDPARLCAQAQTLERLNRGALAEMRMLLFELRPDALDTLPLAQLLQHPIEALQARGDIQVEHQIGPDGALLPATRLHLYRIAQEALSNIARHSGARNASLRWQPDAAGGAVLHIADDGGGFDPLLARPGHFGLDHLRSRAADIGASLVLRSAPGEGTELLLTLPSSDPPTALPEHP